MIIHDNPWWCLIIHCLMDFWWWVNGQVIFDGSILMNMNYPPVDYWPLLRWKAIVMVFLGSVSIHGDLKLLQDLPKQWLEKWIEHRGNNSIHWFIIISLTRWRIYTSVSVLTQTQSSHWLKPLMLHSVFLQDRFLWLTLGAEPGVGYTAA